jgi:mono/diheme cytochrome c family protein
LLTLADYLSFNMPLPADKIPADIAKASWDKLLPRDGRDLVLTYCQSCHIITVPITQDRTKEAWLGTMNKPSHVEIETTQAEREALASYLVINAGIPIDLVPEELRAGGASY